MPCAIIPRQYEKCGLGAAAIPGHHRRTEELPLRAAGINPWLTRPVPTVAFDRRNKRADCECENRERPVNPGYQRQAEISVLADPRLGRWARNRGAPDPAHRPASRLPRVARSGANASGLANAPSLPGPVVGCDPAAAAAHLLLGACPTRGPPRRHPAAGRDGGATDAVTHPPASRGASRGVDHHPHLRPDRMHAALPCRDRRASSVGPHRGDRRR
jgi:hypothetical protein